MKKMTYRVHGTMRSDLTTPSTTPFCTIEEAARRSGLAQGYIRQLARKGEIPVVKVGRIYRVNYARFIQELGVQSLTDCNNITPMMEKETTHD